MGRRRGTSAFPVARIKKMMQSDDEVGKIATVTPMLVAKALECMMELVVTEASQVAIDRRSRTVTPLHLKTCVMRNESFDFMRHVFDAVEGVLEPSPEQILAVEPDGSPVCGDSGSSGDYTMDEGFCKRQDRPKKSSSSRSRQLAPSSSNMGKRPRSSRSINLDLPTRPSRAPRPDGLHSATSPGSLSAFTSLPSPSYGSLPPLSKPIPSCNDVQGASVASEKVSCDIVARPSLIADDEEDYDEEDDNANIAVDPDRQIGSIHQSQESGMNGNSNGTMVAPGTPPTHTPKADRVSVQALLS